MSSDTLMFLSLRIWLILLFSNRDLIVSSFVGEFNTTFDLDVISIVCYPDGELLAEEHPRRLYLFSFSKLKRWCCSFFFSFIILTLLLLVWLSYPDCCLNPLLCEKGVLLYGDSFICIAPKVPAFFGVLTWVILFNFWWSFTLLIALFSGLNIEKYYWLTLLAFVQRFSKLNRVEFILSSF